MGENMNLDYIMIKYTDLKLDARYSGKFRGYIGNKYIEENLFHNHNTEGVIYRYPLVQYKIVNKTPMIIGINEGAKVVRKIAFENEIELDNSKIQILSKEIKDEIVLIEEADEYIHYEFLTPWIALNQKNIKEYKNSNSIEKEELLKKILIGNVISTCKGLNYTIEKQLYCWHNLKPIYVNLKNVKHVAFKGEFKINFKLPQYIGIGKSVSKGFGTIKLK